MNLFLALFACILLSTSVSHAQVFPGSTFLGPTKQNCYGPGVGCDATGRPFYWDGGQGMPDPTVRPNFTQPMGPGLYTDQYGRPLTPRSLGDTLFVDPFQGTPLFVPPEAEASYLLTPTDPSDPVLLPQGRTVDRSSIFAQPGVRWDQLPLLDRPASSHTQPSPDALLCQGLLQREREEQEGVKWLVYQAIGGALRERAEHTKFLDELKQSAEVTDKKLLAEQVSTFGAVGLSTVQAIAALDMKIRELNEILAFTDRQTNLQKEGR